MSFDASSEVHEGEDLALAVGSGKVRGGSSNILGGEVKRAGPQREQDGGNSFVAKTDSIKQQYRTAVLRVETHTQQLQNQPFIWITGCRPVLLCKCMGGRTWPLRLEVASLKVREVGIVFGEGVKRAGSQREHDGRNSCPAPTRRYQY